MAGTNPQMPVFNPNVPEFNPTMPGFNSPPDLVRSVNRETPSHNMCGTQFAAQTPEPESPETPRVNLDSKPWSYHPDGLVTEDSHLGGMKPSAPTMNLPVASFPVVGNELVPQVMGNELVPHDPRVAGNELVSQAVAPINHSGMGNFTYADETYPTMSGYENPANDQTTRTGPTATYLSTNSGSPYKGNQAGSSQARLVTAGSMPYIPPHMQRFARVTPRYIVPIHATKQNYLVVPDGTERDWQNVPSRFLKVSRLALDSNPFDMKSLFESFGDVKEMFTGKLHSTGIMIVHYFDVRDALKAYQQVRETWQVQFCTLCTLDEMNGDLASHTPQNEGEIACVVISNKRAGHDAHIFRQIFGSFGDISGFKTIVGAQYFTVVCEFYDSRHAQQAISLLDDETVDNFHLRIKLYKPDIAVWCRRSQLVKFSDIASPKEALSLNLSPAPAPPRTMNLLGMPRGTPISLTSFLEHNSSRKRQSSSGTISRRHQQYRSDMNTPARQGWGTGKKGGFLQKTVPANEVDQAATALADLTLNRFGDPLPTQEPSEQSNVNGERPSRNNRNRSTTASGDGSLLTHQNTIPNKNIIDLDLIVKGEDKRTTIMIRNIPNKVQQGTLKEWLDKTSEKDFDFLYLRIDFRNYANVGYAFVNFIEPMAIVDFIRERAGKKWELFSSEKVAEVSYANIQGKETLIEKFRNSSVMDENPAFRPKIFHTENDLRGVEMEFPKPNNLNRKLRSITAAHQMGLFKPKLTLNGSQIP